MKDKILVINTANRAWSVIDSYTLKSKFYDFSFLELYYSVSGYSFENSLSSLDELVVSCIDNKDLISNIKLFEPSVIYLRVSPHTRSEYLCKVIRDEFPSVKLFIEFYDMSLNFDEEDLNYIHSNNVKNKENSKAGCFSALKESDVLIFKCGGESFEKWISKKTDIPVVNYFPNISSDNFSLDRGSSDKRKILYAGSVNSREFNESIGVSPGANILNYFSAISNSEELELTIVNATHWHESEDASARNINIMKWVKDKGINYHRSISLDKLKPLMADYDLGLCCSHYKFDRVMDVTRFGVPNRVSTYLSEELPVIIDDRFEYMASLISDFSAGIVVPAGEFEEMIGKINSLDIKKVKSGVVKLKSFLSNKNDLSLSRLLEIATENKNRG